MHSPVGYRWRPVSQRLTAVPFIEQDRVILLRRHAGQHAKPQQLVCIVGRGLHSEGHKSKLAPAVTSLAHNMQLGITADKPHVGCLLIDCNPPKNRVGFFNFIAERCVIM